MASPAPTRSSAQISRVPYLPGLDGMRALAVVAVMVYHANSDWLHGGFLGVEVFFIISGYLITLLLVSEHEKNGRVSLGQFWLRRARRLLPALFTMMIGLTVYVALFERDELGSLRGDVVAGTTYVSNWYQIWTGAGYTALNQLAPLRHLWSLAVEEQFYLFWPLVMIGILARGRSRLPRIGLYLLLASVGITLVTAVLYHPGAIGECDVTPDAYFHIAGRCLSKMDALYLSTPTRMSGILLGAGMALWWRPIAIMRSPMRDKGVVVDGLAVVGLLGLGALMWSIHLSQNVVDQGEVASRFLFQGGFFLVGLATMAVIAAVTHQRALAGRVLGNPVLLWIGTRSYGLYLYHWPIYQLLRGEAGKKLDPAQFALAMVITVVLTELSFRFIETPIRTGHLRDELRSFVGRGDARVRRRRALATGLVAVALPVFAGVNLATAELKKSEFEQNLEQNEQATTGLDDLLGGSQPPTGTVSPSDTSPGDGTGDSTPGQGSSPDSTTKPRKTTTTTAKPKERIDVFALGDSVMLGAAAKLSARGATVDAEVNRQGTTGAEILEALKAAQLLGNVVVLHLGTNGSVSTATFDRMMAAVDKVPLVVVMTVRANRGWTGGNNAIIRELPRRYGNVKVLDWEAESNACPGDCFYGDGIHLKSAGQDYYSALIWRAIGRA